MSYQKRKDLTISSVPQYLKVANDLKLNLALCGAHGRAKTAVIQQYADKHGYKLITLILSRFVPEDMLGLPVVKTLNGEKVTSYSNPDWLVEACTKGKKVLLFFDEFNNAEMDVQASILNLIEDRTMGGLSLNDNTQIVMAFNPVSIAPNGKIFSKATRDRLCIIPILDRNKKDYSDYFTKKGYNKLHDLFTEMPEIIKDYDEESIEAAYENAEFTPRSIEKSYKIVEYVKNKKLDIQIAKNLVCGYAGWEGLSFINYMEAKYEEETADTEIINEYKNSKNIEEFKQSTTLINTLGKYGNNYFELRKIVNKLEEVMTKEDFKNFLNSCVCKEFVNRYEFDKLETATNHNS